MAGICLLTQRAARARAVRTSFGTENPEGFLSIVQGETNIDQGRFIATFIKEREIVHTENKANPLGPLQTLLPRFVFPDQQRHSISVITTTPESHCSARDQASPYSYASGPKESNEISGVSSVMRLVLGVSSPPPPHPPAFLTCQVTLLYCRTT